MLVAVLAPESEKSRPAEPSEAAEEIEACWGGRAGESGNVCDLFRCDEEKVASAGDESERESSSSPSSTSSSACVCCFSVPHFISLLSVRGVLGRDEPPSAPSELGVGGVDAKGALAPSCSPCSFKLSTLSPGGLPAMVVAVDSSAPCDGECGADATSLAASVLWSSFDAMCICSLIY
jgi:hypothetical protein